MLCFNSGEKKLTTDCIGPFATAFVTFPKPAGNPKALHPKQIRRLRVRYLTRMDESILDAKNAEVSETPMQTQGIITYEVPRRMSF